MRRAVGKEQQFTATRLKIPGHNMYKLCIRREDGVLAERSGRNENRQRRGRVKWRRKGRRREKVREWERERERDASEERRGLRHRKQFHLEGYRASIHVVVRGQMAREGRAG